MTVADEHLARVGTVLDEWDREDAASDSAGEEELPECVRNAVALAEALQPMTAITIRLGNGAPPGTDAAGDASWAASVALARRDILAHDGTGIDRGLDDDSLRLLDRIDALAGARPDGDWENSTRRQVQGLVDARRQGRQRGLELRESCPDAGSRDLLSIGWLLRHPADHWLRQALPTISDPECRASIQAQIARLQPSYQRLCALHWAAEEAVAEMICAIRVLDASPGAWKRPVSAVVTGAIKGNTSPGERIAVRVVADPDGPFDGTLIALLAGDRWAICARELRDGTVLPLDGTRRQAVASP